MSRSLPSLSPLQSSPADTWTKKLHQYSYYNVAYSARWLTCQWQKSSCCRCCCCCCYWVNSFSTRRLSSCTDEYALTYDIFHLLSKQWSCKLGLGLRFPLRAARVHTQHIHSRNMQTPCRIRVDRVTAAFHKPDLVMRHIPTFKNTAQPLAVYCRREVLTRRRSDIRQGGGWVGLEKVIPPAGC